MKTEENDSARTVCSPVQEAGAPSGGPRAGPAAWPLHARSFKLRFATQREPGRSYVSLVKPLGLPATVTDKFYRREEPAAVDEERTQRALRRIEDTFALGPREKYAAPITSSQTYGWHAPAREWGGPGAPHHLRESAWLRARLRVLADDKLRR